MAKTLLEFEDEIINTYDIQRISKDVTWDYKNEEQNFSIIINKGYEEVPGAFVYKFEYKSEKLRDDKYTILKLQLDDLEYFEFVEG